MGRRLFRGLGFRGLGFRIFGVEAAAFQVHVVSDLLLYSPQQHQAILCQKTNAELPVQNESNDRFEKSNPKGTFKGPKPSAKVVSCKPSVHKFLEGSLTFDEPPRRALH